ncbi:MAG: endolytic transglycosylase MltG [Paludibacteraceae bacterium]|nr:endolytic transglycosylase MltG [Paludibacteraceae bacterium]
MKEKRLKKRYFLRLFLAILSIMMLGIAGIAMKHYYRLEISNFESKDGEAHGYHIYPGTSIEQVLVMMEEDYDIGSRQDVMLHARLLHFNYPEPGYYEFESQLGNRSLIERLKIGDQTPIRITWNNAIRTREQLAGQVSSNLMMDSVTLLQYLEDEAFLEQYGMNKETSRCLFIPNTYEVYWTITPEQLFERMDREFNTFWNLDRRDKAEAEGLTPVEVMILASIIEGESRNKQELPIIASLYLNRVHKGMLLQACPTVIYAVGDFKIRRVLYSHLKTDSPYNTYIYRGLPPGPIRCPSPQAIDYVLNAPKTNYLYMCANPELNGTHIFSSSFNAHINAANEYHAMMDTLR